MLKDDLTKLIEQEEELKARGNQLEEQTRKLRIDISGRLRNIQLINQIVREGLTEKLGILHREYSCQNGCDTLSVAFLYNPKKKDAIIIEEHYLERIQFIVYKEVHSNNFHQGLENVRVHRFGYSIESWHLNFGQTNLSKKQLFHLDALFYLIDKYVEPVRDKKI